MTDRIADLAAAGYDENAMKALVAADPLDKDRVTRWQPTAAQLRWAQALFDADPEVTYVIVALVHPGKDQGCWTLDTVVEPVPGLWLVLGDGRDYDTARNQAWHAAQDWLGDRSGTTSYVVIGRDGSTPAFED